MSTTESFNDLFDFIQNIPNVMTTINSYTDEDWGMGWDEKASIKSIKQELEGFSEIYKRITYNPN
ncbi:hypothetical protein NEIG_00344 [Nematocida sp. ERTm5]|nr:hypothetical protein NEIRO02_1881 [Nematocida sp. AWRm79]KAI5184852.1 hypothetical protein NEIRO03_1857 [Nematocida sp. AWRm78]OAG30860.1 hypothetical protein NEIG_00344 [Nematocida sp. ERTm5]